jgi:hypothetical protein
MPTVATITTAVMGMILTVVTVARHAAVRVAVPATAAAATAVMGVRGTVVTVARHAAVRVAVPATAAAAPTATAAFSACDNKEVGRADGLARGGSSALASEVHPNPASVRVE